MDNKDKKGLLPVSPDAINEAKAKYGEARLMLIEVETGDKKIDYLLRKPTRSVIEAISRHKNDVAASNKILIANCVLAGDADALENDGDVYAQVVKHIASLVKGAKATIKKL